MDIKIKLINEGKMPKKAHANDAAFDCYANIDVTIHAKERGRMIPLGFAIDVPPGWVAKLLPRSSTGIKTPLRMSHSEGVIDAGFQGEVNAIYDNISEYSAYHIAKGDRICQMLLERVEEVTLTENEEFSESERGENGWGSTGK